MRVPITISALLHVVVIAVMILGLPWFASEPVEPAPPVIEVQLAEVAEKTTPPPKPAPEVKPEPPKPEAKPEPPKPVAKVEPPKPETKPEVKPEPPKPITQPAPPKPEVKPEPKAEPAPEPLPPPKPKEPPKKVAEAPPPPPAPIPKAKPAPPKPAFDPSKLAALIDRRIKSNSSRAAEEPKPKASQVQVTTAAADPSQRLTVSEIDLIRAQIVSNWFPPFGAKDAAQMEVYIRISVNPDGTLAGNPTITKASQVDPEQMQPFIDSTVRAILKSQPLKVPPGKYEAFRDMTLRFNLKDMLGG